MAAGQQGDQVFLGAFDKPADAAFQLPHSRPGRPSALGGDQRHHGFRPAQVYPPVQKRPLGELARLRGPRAQAVQGVQHALGRPRSAVEVDFRHVLTGIAAGSAHEHGHALVQSLAFIHDMAVGHFVAFPGMAGHKQPGKQRFRLRPADAHDGDAPFSLGGGQRGDGIPFHSNLLCE